MLKKEMFSAQNTWMFSTGCLVSLPKTAKMARGDIKCIFLQVILIFFFNILFDAATWVVAIGISKVMLYCKWSAFYMYFLFLNCLDRWDDSSWGIEVVVYWHLVSILILFDDILLIKFLCVNNISYVHSSYYCNS